MVSIVIVSMLLGFVWYSDYKDKKKFDEELNRKAREGQTHLWRMLEAINRQKHKGDKNEHHSIYR